MKRTLKYALVAVLSVGMVLPALAQDNFPDTPENHWAYEALAKLKKDGLLVGYPDGLYRGSRTASRYELAVAVHSAFTNLKNTTDGLQTQIDALKNAGDVSALRDALKQLQTEVSSMQAYGADIANMKKLADTFQNELHALGVDVDQLKKDLGDLTKRVTALEAKKPAVDISGDANFFIAAGNSKDGMAALNKDGRIAGVLHDNDGNPIAGAYSAGLDKDVSVLHEAAFKLAGTNTTGPTWSSTIVLNNTLNAKAFGDEATSVAGVTVPGNLVGTPYSDNGKQSVFIQDLSVKFDSALAGYGFNAEVGRLGYKVNPIMFQRQAVSTYFSTERSTNGNYYIDGATLGFSAVGSKIGLVLGRTSQHLDNNGTDINPVYTTGYGGAIGKSLSIDRVYGVTADTNFFMNSKLNLAYLMLEGNPSAGTGDQVVDGFGTQVNRVDVYGGSLDFTLGPVKMFADYSKSEVKDNDVQINSKDADVYIIKASYGAGPYGISAAYKSVGAYYIAPGDWGRVGLVRNPNNIKGTQVGGFYNLSPMLTLTGNYEHYEAKNNDYAATSGFGSGTKYDGYNIALGYKLNTNFDVKLGYEDDKFDGLYLGAATLTPEYKWTTLGFGYGLSETAKLTLQYELSDVTNDVFTTGAATNYKGGFLSSQLSVKF